VYVSKTPFRISLFGGGTDFPHWYNNYPGAVVSFTINKYCYLSYRNRVDSIGAKYRVISSKIEDLSDLENITNPAIRAALKIYNEIEPFEIFHSSDLPSQSGVGSSSAFAVGLINILQKKQGLELSKKDIASEAINLEQNVLNENVGSQDQIACAFGGINRILFEPNKDWRIEPLNIAKDKIGEIENRSFLVYSGIQRISSHISGGFLKNLSKFKDLVETNYLMTNQAYKIFNENEDLDHIGGLLNESWRMKKKINPLASNITIDQLYSKGMDAGALGGKILGAGGGGFILFWLPKNYKDIFRLKFKVGKEVDFKIDFTGTSIISNY
jgi:D-glycero-alpha-D-manno-heptose-7-phosphate kinase